MAREILTNYDFKNAGRIVNLPDAVDDHEPATLSQLKASIQIDALNAVDGSIPIYNQQSGKFIANQLDTKLTITDGGNF